MPVAVVTGASGGIGGAVARALAAAGWAVCVSYLADEAGAVRVARDCAELGALATPAACDVTDHTSVRQAFDRAGELGPIGALVNNAGVVAPQLGLIDMPPERVERVVRINLVGALLCAREAARRMSVRRGGDGGVIVNVSSAAARLGSPDEYVDYAASKGGIDTLTVGLAKELARDGIRVNAVRPGLIATGLHAANGDPGRLDRLAPTIPLGRPGQPGEVAAAIRWLCSDEASYVTGAVLDVAGGR